MKIISILKRIFGQRPTKKTSEDFARFGEASESFNDVHEMAESYTLRAINRNAIRNALHKLYSSELTDKSAGNAYDEAVAEFTDPDDFKDYNAADLDAHSAIIEKVNCAFDYLTTTFKVLDKKSTMYGPSKNLNVACAEIYLLTASGYSDAATCSVFVALEGQVQAVKDELGKFFFPLNR